MCRMLRHNKKKQSHRREMSDSDAAEIKKIFSVDNKLNNSWLRAGCVWGGEGAGGQLPSSALSKTISSERKNRR